MNATPSNESAESLAAQPAPIQNGTEPPIALSAPLLDSEASPMVLPAPGLVGSVQEEVAKRTLKPIATQQDIDNALPNEKLKLGGSLYLWVSANGRKKTFKFRSHFNGRDKWVNIGSYPKLSIEKAREEVEEKYRPKIESARQLRSNVDWESQLKSKKVTKSAQEKLPAFHSKEDATEFVRLLHVDHNPPDIQMAIWLQMLMPSRSTEILTAKWSDFGWVNKTTQETYYQPPRWPDSNTQPKYWVVRKKNKADQNAPQSVELLSNIAIQYLTYLYNRNPGNEYLFPDLCDPNITVADRKKLIDDAIGIIWKKYPVTPTTFKNYFILEAIKESYFTPAFIKAMISPKEGKSALYNKPDLTPQKIALNEWWSNKLLKIKDPPISINKEW